MIKGRKRLTFATNDIVVDILQETLDKLSSMYKTAAQNVSNIDPHTFFPEDLRLDLSNHPQEALLIRVKELLLMFRRLYELSKGDLTKDGKDQSFADKYLENKNNEITSFIYVVASMRQDKDGECFWEYIDSSIDENKSREIKKRLSKDNPENVNAILLKQISGDDLGFDGKAL